MHPIVDSFQDAIAALLPSSCALCAQPTLRTAVCADCEDDLPLPLAQCCPQCGELSDAHALCEGCRSEPPAFDASIAVWPYAFPVDHLIQELKYRHRLPLGPWFAERIHRLIGHGRGLIDAVVPMPLHAARLCERGFNQAYEIARPLARDLDRPLLAVACRRIRDTAQQARLDRQARRQNLTDAFECNLDLRGQTILLVDDVMTTGASADAVALALKRAGAERVLVAVVARVHRPRDSAQPPHPRARGVR